MQNESFGKVLPQILLPFARQWAERSGMPALSRLLVDDQFLGLIERYADDLLVPLTKVADRPGNGNGRGNGHKPSGNGHASPRNVARPAPEPETRADGKTQMDDELSKLHERVSAMEEQQRAQQALFEVLRMRIRPLALALGCCPECLVGLDGCPKCLGRSNIGYFEPDQALLRALVIHPLAARDIPIVLAEKQSSQTDTQSQNNSITKKRSKHARTRNS
jgi:hypothetical protein